MSAYSDEDDAAYDSDAAFDSGDDDANALLDDDDEFVPTKDKGKSVAIDVPHESLSPAKLQALIEDDVQRVVGVLGCDAALVQILLLQNRWDTDKVIERFLSSREDTLRAAGEPASVIEPSSPQPPPAKRARVSEPEFTCEICFDTPGADGAFALRCAHRFCTGCWEAYLGAAVRDEGRCLITCMSAGCKTVVDAPALARLADAQTHERWQTLLAQSYVGARPALRFCPHPGCAETVSCAGAAGSARLSAVPSVRCGAGHAFCAGCGLDADHRPIVCPLAAAWIKNAREDAGTSQWIKANTRECPKCKGIIEKGGGCNRMMCRHCNFQFCWLCMQNWDVHGYNDKVCSTWKEPDATEDMTDAKRNLERWLFYFDRFNNHELSAKLDRERLEQSAERITEVQNETGMSWIEAHFMRQAVEELSRCRLTLKWSYTMAYFLAAGNDKQIFEDIQADLEIAVEKLSQLLEEDINPDTIKDLRQNTLNKTAYVRSRHDIILHDTAKGLAEGTWKWIQPVD